MVLGDYRTDNSNNHVQFYIIIVNFNYEQFPIIYFIWKFNKFLQVCHLAKNLRIKIVLFILLHIARSPLNTVACKAPSYSEDWPISHYFVPKFQYRQNVFYIQK